MSLQVTNKGQIITGINDVISGDTASTWDSLFTLSGNTWTFTASASGVGATHQKDTLIQLKPYDIYVVEFDVICSTYPGGSGLYIGGAKPNWTSGNITNYQSAFDFSTGKWGSWASTANSYYINNYITTSWGHVKTYACGASVSVNMIPAPERNNGAASYAIYCIKACDGSASTHVYPNKLHMFRTGWNTLTSGVTFKFRNIRCYRLGANCISDGFNTDSNGFKAHDIWEC